MPRKPVESVDYNSGDGTRFALVVDEKGDHKLDLAVLTDHGFERVNDVPRRAPADYGPEGGGRTWH